MVPGVRVTRVANDVREMRLESEVALRDELRGAPQIDSSGNRDTLTLIDSWQIRVQHGAGSLEAAVALGRRRNLTLSFGILSLLVAAMVLVFVNARRAERLAAQQMHFVATVSHELRTPLAVIRSAAENISAGIVTDPDQAVRYGRLIETEGRRLTGMVEQVLAHAGITSPTQRVVRTRPVDVRRVVSEAVTATASLAEQVGCRLTVDVEPDLPAAMADDLALRSALENLLTNALKHAASGRDVAVRASRAREGAGMQSRGGTPLVRVDVSDKGPGIDATDLPHIFEPFYRGQRAVDAQIQGSGLGLSLVKRSVEDMGGRVEYQQAPEGGSIFSIVLMAASEAAESAIA
jgi:signal transduction histidine kinase